MKLKKCKKQCKLFFFVLGSLLITACENSIYNQQYGSFHTQFELMTFGLVSDAGQLRVDLIHGPFYIKSSNATWACAIVYEMNSSSRSGRSVLFNISEYETYDVYDCDYIYDNRSNIVSFNPHSNYLRAVNELGNEVSYEMRDNAWVCDFDYFSELFIVNKTYLTKAGKSELERVVSEYSIGDKIHLEGVADSTGDYENNFVLAKGRAESVKSYLISEGVVEADISVRSFVVKAKSTFEERKKQRKFNITLTKRVLENPIIDN